MSDSQAPDLIRRNTTFAVVQRIRTIYPHPDPRIKRVEIVELTSGTKLVTGKHYREGDRGVYLRPGCLIPGFLAEELWLVGKKRARAWFEVRDIPIGLADGEKVDSPGLWCGEWYRNDGSPESLEKARSSGAEVDAEGYVHWKFWRAEWQEGFTLDDYFGIVEVELGVLRPDGSRHDPAYTRRGNR